MSAFTVGNKHISAMLQAAQRSRHMGDSPIPSPAHGQPLSHALPQPLQQGAERGPQINGERGQRVGQEEAQHQPACRRRILDPRQT